MTGQDDDGAPGGAAIAARRTESQGLLALAIRAVVLAALYCKRQVLIPLTSTRAVSGGPLSLRV